MRPEEAEELFLSLGAVPVERLTGIWRGRSVGTGHPVDELLRVSGWIGKEFLTAEAVHPLVCQGAFGRYRMNPGLVPLGLIRGLGMARWPGMAGVVRVLGPLLATRVPRARLRMIDDRGTVTAAMVYDQRPIIDVFREVDADTVMGRMDERGQRAAFFVLSRDAMSPSPALPREGEGGARV
jgi:hypothetical protein